MSRRHHSPFGWLVWRLMTRRSSAGEVLATVFRDSALRPLLTRAIRHGSFVNGDLAGPVLYSDGTSYRPPSRRVEDDITRSLESLAAARVLASFLMYAERADLSTRKASGRACWQGNHARRLKLTSTRGALRADGTRAPPGGVREVQRYARILEGAGALVLLQPNAANVPDGMRAEPNAVGDQWAYNIVTIAKPLPLDLQNVLRAWRGEAPALVPPRSTSSTPPNAEPLPAGELALLSAQLSITLSTRTTPRAI